MLKNQNGRNTSQNKFSEAKIADENLEEQGYLRNM